MLLVARIVVLVIRLDTGDDDAARMEVKKMAAVFAGFGDEVGVAFSQSGAAAETGDGGPRENGRGKPQSRDDRSGHRRRRGLSVDAGDSRGICAGGQPTESLGIAENRYAPARRLEKLRVRIARIRGRMHDEIDGSVYPRGVKTDFDRHIQLAEYLVGVKDVGDVASAESSAPGGQDLGQSRHARALRSHEMHAKSRYGRLEQALIHDSILAEAPIGSKARPPHLRRAVRG